MTVYRIGEALRLASLSRATYFRWVRLGRCPDAQFRDRNGRRVFTTDEVRDLERLANRLTPASESSQVGIQAQGRQ